MGTIDSATRSDLTEIIDERAVNRSTIVSRQLSVEHGHASIGDAIMSISSAQILVANFKIASNQEVVKMRGVLPRPSVAPRSCWAQYGNPNREISK